MYPFLSYDVAAYDHACNNTLMRTCNMIYNVSVNILLDIVFILKGIKSHFKGSYD